MQKIFHTRQFMAGNSPAVRIPMGMAFPDKTELVVVRDGDRIIVEEKKENLGNIPELFARLGRYHNRRRPEFIDVERKCQS